MEASNEKVATIGEQQSLNPVQTFENLEIRDKSKP